MTLPRAILLLALIAGALLRAGRLDVRPMHTDEAVHAVKFGDLLERGVYRYDRTEYHGPTLNYFSLIPAWLSSEKTLAQVTETTLRIVPVFFGFVLIGLPILIARADALPASIAGLLTACSPAMVFYSRYYIQEMLLVTFAFGCIVAAHRALVRRSAIWSAVAGICAGLTSATKETWIIQFGLMVIAALIVIALRKRHGESVPRPRAVDLFAASVSFCAVPVILYSSFFTHWPGVADAVTAYGTYVTRAGETSRHGHPFLYYIGLLAGSQGEHGPLWTELAILAAGLAGIVGSLRRGEGPGRHGFELFIALYALLLMLALSSLPYKTPWLMLGALQPLIVVAGFAIAALVRRLDGRWPRAIVVTATALVTLHLGWQAYMGSYVYSDDPVNPYVYSQPNDDIRQIAQAVTHAASSVDAAVLVVCTGSDYWPLPWYFRQLPRVGWWSAIDSTFVPATVILVSPDLEQALLARLYEVPPPGKRNLYVSLFERPMYLRPGKEIRGYARYD